jgi:hypothetical protein
MAPHMGAGVFHFWGMVSHHAAQPGQHIWAGRLRSRGVAAVGTCEGYARREAELLGQAMEYGFET